MKLHQRQEGLYREIVAEASEWFIDFRAEDVSAAARDRFVEWLRRSPQHIQAYLEVAGAWSEMPASDEKGRIDVAALVARARAAPDITPVMTLRTGGSPSQWKPARRAQPRRFLAAASILFVALLAGVSAWVGISRHDVYTTAIGEQRSLRLPDGSTVELNARSRLKLRYTDSERSIDLLEGQAMFQVARDAQRPFTVRIGEAEVRAVGTQFDVYRKKAGTVVTVVEGRVAVRADTRDGGAERPHSLLSAGEQVVVTPKRAVPPPKRVDASVATAWVQKHLMFDDTPLEEVAEEFNRYNPRPLVIDDPQLRKAGISGVYSSTDPASLLGFLRDQPGVEIIEGAREIRILRRESR